MQEIRRCPDDDYFEGASCPVCGADGRLVVPSSRPTQLSKFLSGALRHFPADVGIEFDASGWTDHETLVERTQSKYAWFEPEMVAAVVATDPKGRFELDEDRIRATYGHSVDVTLEPSDSPVPDELFHGTASDTVDRIMAEGLKPMDRQLVHLSDSIDEARAVGSRHAVESAVLRVDAEGLRADGWDVTKRGHHVFTVERVPPEYLTPIE